MFRKFLFGVVFSVATLFGFHAADSVLAAETHYLDVHAHLWWPRTSAPVPQASRVPYPALQAARNLVQQMDGQGVAVALILPPPQTQANADSSLLDELIEISMLYPGRFRVAGGGDVLNPMIHQIAVGKVTEQDKTAFRKSAETLVKKGIVAFGEMTALHLSFFPQHPFEMTPADHPLFLLLADVSAQYKIPIDLHMEAVSADMPLPAGFGEPNAKVLKENIAGLEHLLAHQPAANIVWQHIGWDNTGHMTPALMRKLLSAHPNLFLALRVEERMQTKGGTPMPHRILDAGGKIAADWLDLMKSFPDRFMIGSDEFFPPPGSPRRWPQSFDETWKILGQLPADLARQIGRDNAQRIYHLVP